MPKWVKVYGVMLLACGILSSYAQQSDEQLWLDYQVSYPFGNRYLLENTTTYSTLLNPDEKWWSLNISPTFEYTLFTWLDLTSEVPIGYTIQKEGITTFEITPILGGRLHITQNRRVNIRFLARYQQRYFYQREADDWDISNRTRFKVEFYLCMNGPNLFADKLWYGIMDYEEFIVLDQQLDERYANRRRARTGLGYRLNYKHRFELIYTLQSSRDELDDSFIRADNILQLRYKMFLNPTKPADE
ncbi:MAG: DUF2490 domain-containing protein [Cyclobacteriaceae bacterium]|jgi:hypothetical protein|nr:DUF2490 domain-containing protein [Cyclobacteriaceae bacterium]